MNLNSFASFFSRLAIVAALGFTLAAALGQESMPKNQTSQAFQRKITRTVSARYLAYLPPGYEARGTQRWPLILFLHGAGERGTNLNKVAAHGPPKIVSVRPELPFLVISPQCPNGEVWDPDLLLALLEDVGRKYKVDHSRVYLTGLSMGGYGTWKLGLARPDKFAALTPICGGGSNLDLLLADRKLARRLKEIPVWAFHGAKDEVVKLDESERMVNSLRQLGNDARLTVDPDAGHDAWTAAYANPALYEWFLQHTNPLVTPEGKPRRR